MPLPLGRVALTLLAGIFTLRAQNRETHLELHTTLAVTLHGVETSVWLLDVPADHAVRLSVREIAGIAGVFTIESALHTAPIRMDCTIRAPSVKNFTLLAGSYRIAVHPSYHSQIDRRFELETGAPFRATDADRQRTQAEQFEGDGEYTYRQIQSGYLPATRDKYQSALRIYTQLGDRTRQADLLNHLGAILYELGQMPPAIETFNRALDLAKVLDDRYLMATALWGLGTVNFDTGQIPKALDYANRALELRRALHDPRGETEALYIRGGSEMILGHNEEARADLQQMVECARIAGERNREDDALQGLAQIEYRLGNYAGAIDLWTQAQGIATQENEKVRAASCMYNIGVVHLNAGDAEESIPYFEASLPVRKTLTFPGSYASVLYHLGLAHLDLGDYQKALDLMNQALPIYHNEIYPVGEAHVLQGLALVYQQMGRDAESHGFLEQALAIFRKASDRRGEAQTLLRLGKPSEALAIARAAGYQAEEAHALTVLGDASLRSRDPAAALVSLQSALDLSRKIGLKLVESKALDLQGRAFTQLGQFDSARAVLNQSLVLRRQQGAASSEAETLFDLATLERESDAPADALAHSTSALDLIESLRASFGSRQSRIEMAASHRQYYDLAIRIAMDSGDPARAFEIGERARARGLLDFLAEAQIDIRQGVDPALLAKRRAIEQLLDAKHDRYLALLDTTHTAARENAARKDIDSLVDRLAEIEGQIRMASPAYAALTQPRPLSLAAAQAQLPGKDAVLIEFWLGDPHSFAWIVSGTGCRGVVLPPREAIESAARRLYQALSTHKPQPDTSALRNILAPALQPSAPVRQWWIVSDGALEYVPFAAVLSASHQVVELPSASVLAEVRHQIAGRRPAPQEIAVFADPVFRADDERVEETIARASPSEPALTRAVEESGLASLPRLHFSREEAEAIAALARRKLILLDFAATRAAAEAPSLANYRILHFATHGLIDSRDPELSGIVFSLVDRQGRHEDGFLRLHEIYNLKLNADLVVLSACRTALGESVRSEGMIGLTRGFMYAGAPQVLASLWSVEDRATAEFMRRFYEALLHRGLSAPAALQSAQLSMLHDSRWHDPYYWSAFVLQGMK